MKGKQTALAESVLKCVAAEHDLEQVNNTQYVLNAGSDGYEAKILKSYTINGINYISLEITSPQGSGIWQLPLRSLGNQLNKGVRTFDYSSNQATQ